MGDQCSGTKSVTLLSWTLALLAISLVGFVVLPGRGIDALASYWREKYYVPVVLLALGILLGVGVRANWSDFRETASPWKLFRTAAYVVFTITIVGFFLWKAVFGTA